MSVIDNTVTRFPNGLTNNADNNVFANLKIPEETGYHYRYEDFDVYTAAQWSTGGVGTPVAPALVAGDGGIISIANSAADNDNNWLQQLVTGWTFVSGKKLFFRARAQVDNATQCDLAFGLQVAVSSNNFLTPADGVFFRKDDDATSMFIVSRVGSVETVSSSIGSIADATQFAVAFAYDGASTILASFNNTIVAALTPSSITAVALKLTAGVQNGSAAARTLLLDQLFCAKER